MRIVDGPRGQTPLIRIRNAWGNEHEWNGMFLSLTYNVFYLKSYSNKQKKFGGKRTKHFFPFFG